MDRRILDEIHGFWFGDLASPTDFPKERSAIWFRQSDETDRYIRETFGPYIPAAASQDWDLSRLSQREQVALVVLLDQFPRNIFRDSAEAFAFDPAARNIARALIAPGWSRFYWIERTFLFVPFEHSEEIADQDYSVFLAAELAVTAPPSLSDYFRGSLDYATKHRDLIRKFGQFAHRNAVLGRASTPEEEGFLKEHGRGY